MKHIKLFENWYNDGIDSVYNDPYSVGNMDAYLAATGGNQVKSGISEAPEEVENILLAKPFKNLIMRIIMKLSGEELSDLKNTLNAKGIDGDSSAEEVHDVVSSVAESLKNPKIEEGEEGKEEIIKDKVAEIMHSIGAGNIAAWGGVPAAIAVGSLTGMPLGFAISWGATAVLMGLAKALDKDEKYLREEMLPGEESETGEGEVVIDEVEE
jgi:hypothetical protein